MVQLDSFSSKSWTCGFSPEGLKSQQLPNLNSAHHLRISSQPPPFLACTSYGGFSNISRLKTLYLPRISTCNGSLFANIYQTSFLAATLVMDDCQCISPIKILYMPNLNKQSLQISIRLSLLLPCLQLHFSRMIGKLFRHGSSCQILPDWRYTIWNANFKTNK